MAGIQRKIPHVETTNARSEMLLFMKHWGSERVVSGAAARAAGKLEIFKPGSEFM
jgi:hypothetical protein